MKDIIEIDGSKYEGGGQVLRTAIAMSIATQKPFYIKNIRAKRKKPGLMPQHRKSVLSAAKLCGASYRRADLGSKRLFFYPSDKFRNKLEIEIGTAGSATLLLQSLLLPAFFAPKTVEIDVVGGTDVGWSIPYDFLEKVIIPKIKLFNLDIAISMIKRGYYPKGKGQINVITEPLDDTTPIELVNPGKLKSIEGISHADSKLQSKKVAEEQAKTAEKILKAELKCPVNIKTRYYTTPSIASGITLWANMEKTTIGADCLADLGKEPKRTGEKAARDLINEINSGAPVDKYTADNLIPFIALFGGRIKVSKITEHTMTNMWVCEHFTDVKFKVEGNIISV